MTHFKKNTATVALIALMSAAPMAAFATESGSPQQSVDADTDETVGVKKVTGEESLAAGATGTPAQSVDADPAETVAANEETEGTIADELPTNSPAVSE
ncbi:hypothetical protein [Sulfitobacter sp. JB4-11]|uniref:hypothetical protein n=1 Tax=Sulfitobacter rhodophyticola TaxID=3238304 RepID=UPI0035131809